MMRPRTFGTPARLPAQSEAAAFIAKMKADPAAHCGECGAPFTPARKVAGYIALHNGNGETFIESRYPLCRACAEILQARGIEGSHAAIDARNAALLALSPVGGTA